MRRPLITHSAACGAETRRAGRNLAAADASTENWYRQRWTKSADLGQDLRHRNVPILYRMRVRR